MVITNPGELCHGYLTVGGNWEGGEFGYLSPRDPARLGWTPVVIWNISTSLSELLFFSLQGLIWPFEEPCPPSLVTAPTMPSSHTPPWEQSCSDFALAALACVCKVTVKFRPDHFSGKELGNWLFEEIHRHAGRAGCLCSKSKWRHYLVVRMEVKLARGYDSQTKAQRNRVLKFF